MNGYFKVVIAFDNIDDLIKKTVDFLNEVSEYDIYAMELRKMVGEDGTIIINYEMYPSTEPQVKRPSRKKRIWSEQLFFDEVQRKFRDEQVVNSIKKLYEFSKNLFGESNVYWGEGERIGTFKIRLPEIFGDKDIYSVETEGHINLAFENIYGISSELDKVVDEFAEKLYEKRFLNVQITHENYHEQGKKYPKVKREQWIDRVDELIEIIKEFYDKIKSQQV